MANWTFTPAADGTLKDSDAQNTNEQDLLTELNGNLDTNNTPGFPINNIGRRTITQIFRASVEDENNPPFRMPGHRFGSQVGPHGYQGANILNESDDDLLLNDQWRNVPGMSKLVPIDRYGRIHFFGFCMFTIHWGHPDPPGQNIKNFPCVEHPFHNDGVLDFWHTGGRHRIAAPNSYFELSVFVDDVQQTHTTRRFGAAACVSVDGYSIPSDSANEIGAVNNRNDTGFSGTTDTYEEPAQRSGGKAFYQVSNEVDYDAPASNRVAKVELKVRVVLDDVVEYYGGTTNTQDLSEMQEYRFRVKDLGLYMAVYSSNMSCMVIKQDPAVL